MDTNTKMYKMIAQTTEAISRLCKSTDNIDRQNFELFEVPS